MFRVDGIYMDKRGAYQKVMGKNEIGLGVRAVSALTGEVTGSVLHVHGLGGQYLKNRKSEYDLLPQEYMWDGHGQKFVPISVLDEKKAPSSKNTTSRGLKPVPLPTPAPKPFDPWKGWIPHVDKWQSSSEAIQQPHPKHPLQQEGDYNNPKHGSSGFFYKETR